MEHGFKYLKKLFYISIYLDLLILFWIRFKKIRLGDCLMDIFLQTIGALNDDTRVKLLHFINKNGKGWKI